MKRCSYIFFDKANAAKDLIEAKSLLCLNGLNGCGLVLSKWIVESLDLQPSDDALHFKVSMFLLSFFGDKV